MRKSTKVLLAVLIIVILAGVAGYLFRDEITKLYLSPTQSEIETGNITKDQNNIEVVAQDLETPWGIAFLPSGDMLVTERPGTLKRVAENQQTYNISGVTETSEGGLLGIALHPEFTKNNYLYLYLTYQQNGDLLNRVERYVYENDQLSNKQIILDGIPGASYHDGGAIAFGPEDKKLYVTTGDAGVEDSAQDTNSLSGKILRLNDDGTIPEDNPFDNPVYSYGHRNPQGITWDDQGRMWSSEHGPSGTASGRDELNLIEKGANYGWPIITGDEQREGMKSPIAQSGDDDTWAPGAITFANESLYFTGLRGQSLYQAKLEENNGDLTVSLSRHLTEEYGRLRAAIYHNGMLYISTSNTDGRGNPKPNDDKILQINNLK